MVFTRYLVSLETILGYTKVRLELTTSLVKWLSVRLRTKWLWIRVPLHTLKFRYRACLVQGVP